MEEEINSQVKAVVMLVNENSAPNVESLPPESKNLESLRWYLGDLRERATANEFPNAEEFAKATKLAEQSLTELIAALKNK